MGVFIFDVHTLGGALMMKEVMDAVKQEKSAVKPLVFGITVLTSMSQDDLFDIGISNPINQQVNALALLAKDCGLSGVVASPHEITKIKEICGKKFLVITPRRKAGRCRYK